MNFKKLLKKISEEWEDENEGDYPGTYAHDNKPGSSHASNFRKAVKTYKKSSLIKSPYFKQEKPPTNQLAIHHFDKNQFHHKFKNDEITKE